MTSEEGVGVSGNDEGEKVWGSVEYRGVSEKRDGRRKIKAARRNPHCCILFAISVPFPEIEDPIPPPIETEVSTAAALALYHQ